MRIEHMCAKVCLGIKLICVISFPAAIQKGTELPSHVLKISIMHLIATQKATLEAQFSEHVAILKCKDILVKKEV